MAITMSRGDDRSFLITVTTEDPENPGTRIPYDLTGCTLWFTVKHTTDLHASDSTDALKVFQKSSAVSGGITISATPSEGTATLEIAAADTNTLDGCPIRLQYDVQLKTSDSKIKTIDDGPFTVTADVTRRIT